MNLAYEAYESCKGNQLASLRAAITAVLAIRPESTLGKLRPIAEMPEKPPEGCVRTYYRMQHGDMALAVESTAEYFCEALLPFPTPDPEAEERQMFEEAMKPAIFMTGVFERDSKGNYIGETINYCWAAWKARAELAKAK